MNHQHRIWPVIFLIGILTAADGTATEQGARDLFVEREVGLTGNVSLTSNYMFPGETESEDRPAKQGGLDYDRKWGPLLGTWWSSASEATPLEADIDA
ncbi:MAG: hypothetical protein JSW50_12120 [Candidatus Latescibacterota bacterium]|nr:MAG: hypothetical protein JSW50_12120 [Candidatus Latescibacterota bacterium]